MLMTHHPDSLSPPQSLHAALVISDSCIFSLKRFLGSGELWVFIWGLQRCWMRAEEWLKPPGATLSQQARSWQKCASPLTPRGAVQRRNPSSEVPTVVPTLYWLSPSPVSLLYSFLTLLRSTSRYTSRP